MPSKYNNTPVQEDGYTFASKAERDEYRVLKLRAQAGEISNLQLQPRFELQPAFKSRAGRRIQRIDYIADFSYVENGQVVVADVKGLETPVFKLKAKLFQFRYPTYTLRLVQA